MTTIEAVRQRVENDAKANGYFLAPDKELLNDLLLGLVKNEERYGYPSCPCRLAAEKLELDRDIICPCDYRDPDVAEYGQCYCGLYVSKAVYEKTVPTRPIPERRPAEKQARAYDTPIEPKPVEPQPKAKASFSSDVKMKLYYCQQCGYVCYREEPPYLCPVCKAKKEMFSELTITVDFR